MTDADREGGEMKEQPGCLSLWRIDDNEFVIASSAEEAFRLFLGTEYCPTDPPAFEESEIDALPADSVFRYHDDSGVIREKTCAEWCLTLGPGYFCSANW